MARAMSDYLFWDVDTQIDFLSPTGNLYVPEGEKIIPNLRRLTQYAADQKIPIVSSTDAHLPTDPEFAQYPPHCLVGTPGQKKVEGTLLPRHYVLPNRKVDCPKNVTEYAQIIVEKQSVDVFTNPNIDWLLRAVGKRKIILYGVVTEICVDRAARGLLERGYWVNVVIDAIKPLDSQLASATLEYVRGHHGQLLSTDELLEHLARTAVA
jgi:nicotinamidase/pyrazinamidase